MQRRKDYLQIRIEADLKKKIEDEAREKRVSASQFVRDILWDLFDAKD